jgi:hypothetical protein
MCMASDLELLHLAFNRVRSCRLYMVIQFLIRFLFSTNLTPNEPDPPQVLIAIEWFKNVTFKLKDQYGQNNQT